MIISCEYDTANDRGRNLSADFDLEKKKARFSVSVFDNIRNVHVKYNFDLFAAAVDCFNEWAKIYKE